MYLRRSYIAYELNSVQHYFLSNGDCLVEFQLQLPSNHPNRVSSKPVSSSSFSRVPSSTEISLLNSSIYMDESNQFQRMGIMCAFDNWDIAQACFDEILSRYSPTSQRQDVNANQSLNSSISSSSTEDSPKTSNYISTTSPAEGTRRVLFLVK